MPNYYPYYSQNYFPPQQQQQQQVVSQNGGFVSAPNEDFARNYPVGFGNSVNFKDEHAPYIYVKTMGLSQFDNPVFEKYRLVKETPSEPSNLPQNEQIDIKSIIESIDKANEQIEAIWAELDRLKNGKEKNTGRTGYSKRDKDGDDRYDEQRE